MIFHTNNKYSYSRKMSAVCNLISLCLLMILLPTYVLGDDASSGDSNNDNNIFGIIPNCVFGPGSVSFIVYTRENPDGVPMTQDDVFCPIAKDQKIFFIVHGFVASPENSNFQYLTQNLLKRFQSRAIVYSLDWSEGACNSGLDIADALAYGSAVQNTQKVGSMLARTAMKLVRNCNASPDSMVLIGHSLGAQVSSFAAKDLKNKYKIFLPALIGMDPAGPLFSGRGCNDRICKTDARFVIVFHTTITLGMSDAVGDCDFYFNGGSLQPGCILPTCSHSRSVIYFANSLLPSCVFVGIQWKHTTISNSTILDCGSQNCTLAGLQSIGKCNGEYYVPTRSVFPYCSNSTALMDVLQKDTIKF